MKVYSLSSIDKPFPHFLKEIKKSDLSLLHLSGGIL